MKQINQIVFLFSLLISCLSQAMLSPLHQAVRDHNLEQVKNLLNSGTDVNAADPSNNLVPLHVATVYNNVSIAEELINAGANINISVKYQYRDYTPLKIAAERGYVALVRLLLNRGANVNNEDLFLVSQIKKIEIAELL